MVFLTYPPAGIDVGGAVINPSGTSFSGDPTGVTYSTAFFNSTLAGAYSNNANQSFGSLPSAVGTYPGGSPATTVFNDSTDTSYRTIGSQVFRFEYSFQLKDGTLSDKPVMVQSASNGLPFSLITGGANAPRPLPTDDSANTSGDLRSALLQPDDAPSAFDVLGSICEKHMAERTGADPQALRRDLEQKPIRLLAPPDYRADVEAFRAFSKTNQGVSGRIRGYSCGRQGCCCAATMPRSRAHCGARGVLFGCRGTRRGKERRSQHHWAQNLGRSDVLQLSVDRMPVSGLDGLRTELGMSHPIREVLLNWPGIEPAFLLIDSLDAVRGGTGEVVFKSLIEQVLSLPGGRWRVIASVRSFDLRLGTQFRQLFPGTPPAPEFTNPDFRNVRHIQVTPWTKEELEGLLAKAPALAAAIAAGGDRLRNLALNPFNTQLLADLLADGVAPTRLSTLSTQAELLDLYWQRRIQPLAPEGDVCLRAVLEEMVPSRSLRASQQTAFGSGGNGLARLLGAGVLVEQSGARSVAFRHHILFDYAASRLYLNPFDAAAVHSAFLRENGLGLMLGPALGYALQELWNSNADRRDYWNMIAGLIGDRAIHPHRPQHRCPLLQRAPGLKSDTDGLIERLSKDGVGRAIFGAIIGSLALWGPGPFRFADSRAVDPGSCRGEQDSCSGQSISFLLAILMKQPTASEHRDELGIAAGPCWKKRWLVQAMPTRRTWRRAVGDLTVRVHSQAITVNDVPTRGSRSGRSRAISFVISILG